MHALLKVAVVQTCATPDKTKTLDTLTQLVRQAAGAGARFVALPENATVLCPQEQRLELAESIDGPSIARLQNLAADLNIALLVGSFIEACNETHTYNTSVLINEYGERRAIYQKIHLFDVTTPQGQTLLESDGVRPGDKVTLAELSPWTLGLSICYDLRFPELYRELSARGAQAFAVPAAFTAETGRDHWQLLLRARAVENLSYVIAPNQWGHHFGDRYSYGRSCIIHPWGQVIAQVPDGPGFALAQLNLNTLDDLRSTFPALLHRRL